MPPSATYDPVPWSAFLQTAASASAALIGLLFVAISINLRDIVEDQRLVARSGKALLSLIGALFASLLCLAPQQPTRLLAAELAVLGLILCPIVLYLLRNSIRENPYISAFHRVWHIALAYGSTLPFLFAGLSLWRHQGGGLYWMLAGFLFSLFATLADAWVLLIEIQR